MFHLASTMFAMGAGGGGGDSNMFAQFIPLILIFAIFWFLVIRPQQKKAKAHRQLVAELKKGDEVSTDSGIVGTVQKVAEDFVTLEIAPKVAIRIVRSRVSDILKHSGGRAPESSTPVESKAKAGKEKGGKAKS